jgi:hypothetical protein
MHPIPSVIDLPSAANIGMTTSTHSSRQGLKLRGSGSGSDEKALPEKERLAAGNGGGESVHVRDAPGRKRYDADGEHWDGGIICVWMALTVLSPFSINQDDCLRRNWDDCVGGFARYI